MARGANPFRRFTDSIRETLRDWFAPLPPPPEDISGQPPREPPRRPPRPPQPPSEPPYGDDDWMRNDWNSEVSRYRTRQLGAESGYSRNEQFELHQRAFYGVAEIWIDEDDQQEAWQDYLDTFVNRRGPRHDTFFEKWNFEKGNFDWQAWRHAMGYDSRK